jgi:hypothetical protein
MTQNTRLSDQSTAGSSAGSRPSPRDVSAVCGLMCVAAVAGVIGLAGGGLDLGSEITARIPGASPVLGAVALGIIVALPMGAAAVAGWRRSRRTADLAILAGTALIGWIVVEVAFIRSFSWLQPACAVYGVVVLVLGVLLRRATAAAGSA